MAELPLRDPQDLEAEGCGHPQLRQSAWERRTQCCVACYAYCRGRIQRRTVLESLGTAIGSTLPGKDRLIAAGLWFGFESIRRDLLPQLRFHTPPKTS